MWDVTDGNNNHLFYVLDYENKEEYNFTGIERKPIPLNLSSDLNEAEVVEYITNYVNKNYVDNLNVDIAFTLWIRVIWNKKVRYYSVRVSDKKIQYVVPDDRYTIDLKEENLIIGV
jgi:hypothetical protein